MSDTARTGSTRRPLPALAFIAALIVLAALVWLRLLHDDKNKNTHGTAAATTCVTPSPSPSPSPSSTPLPPLAAVHSVPLAADVHLVVLNSTNRTGLATATAHTLHKDGFHIATVADDAAKYGGHGLLPGVAEIRFGAAGHAGAVLMRYYLPKSVLVRTASTSDVVIVSLGKKYRATATTAVVHKQLKKAHLPQRHHPRASTKPSTRPSTKPSAKPTPSAGATHSAATTACTSG